MCGRAKRGSTTPLEESEMRTRAGGLGSFSPLEIATEPKAMAFPHGMHAPFSFEGVHVAAMLPTTSYLLSLKRYEEFMRIYVNDPLRRTPLPARIIPVRVVDHEQIRSWASFQAPPLLLTFIRQEGSCPLFQHTLSWPGEQPFAASPWRGNGMHKTVAQCALIG